MRSQFKRDTQVQLQREVERQVQEQCRYNVLATKRLVNVIIKLTIFWQ